MHRVIVQAAGSVVLAVTMGTVAAQGVGTPPPGPQHWYSCAQHELVDCEFADFGKITFEQGDYTVFKLLLLLTARPDQGSREALIREFRAEPAVDRVLDNGVRQFGWVEDDPATQTIRASVAINTLDDRILTLNLSRTGRYYLLWSRIPPTIPLARLSELAERRAGLRRLAPEGAGATVRIGLAAPYSSALKRLALDLERGVSLAAEEINARGGLKVGAARLPVELVIGDDKHNPVEADRIASALAEARVAAVIGHLTNEPSRRANRTYVKHGIPVINPFVIDYAFNEASDRNLFRIAANEFRQMEVLLRYAADDLKARRVGVVNDVSAYGQRNGHAFHFNASRAGLRQEVLGLMLAKPESPGALMKEIREAELDVIFYAGYEDALIRLLTALDKAGSTTPVLAIDGACTPKVASIASAARRLECTMPGAYLRGAAYRWQFTEKFKRRFGENSLDLGPYGYDAMNAIAAAIERAGSVESARVVEALRDGESEGIFGRVAFDGGGEVSNSGVSLLKVEGGKLVWSRNLHYLLRSK